MLSNIGHILQSKDQYHLNISFIILNFFKASTHSMKLAKTKPQQFSFPVNGVLAFSCMNPLRKWASPSPTNPTL